MVAVIHTRSSIHRALNYNEEKVKEKQARCIMAANYPKDHDQLSFSNKLNRLLKQAALNENVKRNSVHISLNFDPSEKLSVETLQAISKTYMDKIGFGEQPYLVYEHNDAGHPHIHIVSVKVKADGKRIDTQNIGRNQSSKARREIEKEFGLVKADERKLKQAFELKPVNAQKVIYGKSATKRAITNVLDTVVSHYKYTSLPELNAVLKLYNVITDRGSEDSRTFQKNGLVYRVLDEKGNKVGVPIKASDIYSKPTLKFIEKKFAENETMRQPMKQRVKNTIDWTLMKKPSIKLTELITALQKEKIAVVLRQNEQGLIYGITYIDHQNKAVFNGSDLGKAYSAKGIIERCGEKQLPEKEMPWQKHQPQTINQINELEETHANVGITDIIDAVIDPENTFAHTPFQLRKKKRKKPNRKT
jgi:hypothetical protein